MQDAEEYYRRTLSAKYLPINPDSKTPSVDKAIRLTGLIVDRMRAWESYEITQEDSKSLREVFNEETQFFDEPDSDKEFRKAIELDDRSWHYKEPHKPKWYFLTLEIDSELRSVFHGRNESVLQNRDANYLIDYAVNLILPTYLIEHGSLFSRWDGNKIVSTNHIVFSGNEIGSIESDNVFFRTNFIHALHSWAKKITDYVCMYAPEVFEKHHEQIDFYFRHGEPAPSSKEPQPPEPGVKLQWKGDKTDLAELVWALAKSGRINDITTGQLVTQKELIRQFERLFALTLDVTGLMKGRMNTYKATSDGKIFTKTLFDSVNDRAANS